MKLTAQLLLKPTPVQAALLLQTMEAANAACDAISQYAWREKVFSKFKIQSAIYHEIKERFGISAQVVIRCISKVCDAYKLDKKRERRFRKHGAIAYDARILKYYQTKVSIWTIEGRERIGFLTRDHHARLLKYQQGESDLVLRNGLFFLLATCAVPESDREAVDGVLGVDLGIKELATDGDGDRFSGEGVEAKRLWYCERRAALQSVGTPAAKRRLKKLSGRERRFRRDINHQISKRLVEKAKDTGRAIALEDLGGIGDRVTVRKSQRARHHSWSFFQLRSFIEYKAKRAGVPLVLVDPRNTSRRCSVCGHCEKKNRKSQSEFVCRSCGHSMNADVNAALNIGAKGAFNLPMVSSIAA